MDLRFWAGFMLATLFEVHAGQQSSASGLWHSKMIESRSAGMLLALLFLFSASLIVVSRHLHLYSPNKVGGILHEQWLTRRGMFHCRSAANGHDLPG